MNKDSTSQPGFTLIELLVSIVLMAFVTTIAANILVISLRGSAKAANVSIVRQQGDSVIAQFSDEVRTATQFLGVNSVNNPLTNITDCTASPGGLHYVQLSLPSAIPSTPTTVTLECDSSDAAHPIARDINDGNGLNSLIDNTTVTVSACLITCTQSPGHLPVLGMSFTLSYLTSAGALSENSVLLNFHTTEAMRNQ